mgnify:CR=1 FL=1
MPMKASTTPAAMARMQRAGLSHSPLAHAGAPTQKYMAGPPNIKGKARLSSMAPCMIPWLAGLLGGFVIEQVLKLG